MDQSPRVSKAPWIILGLLIALGAAGFIAMASTAKTSYAGGAYKGSPAHDRYINGDGFHVTFAGFDGKVEMVHVIDFSPIYEEMEQSRGTSGGGGPDPDTMDYTLQNQITFQKGQWQRSYGSKILFTEDGPSVTFNGLPARQIGFSHKGIPIYVSGVDSDGLPTLGKRLSDKMHSEVLMHCARFENYLEQISENGGRPRDEDRLRLPSEYEKEETKRRGKDRQDAERRKRQAERLAMMRKRVEDDKKAKAKKAKTLE